MAEDDSNTISLDQNYPQYVLDLPSFQYSALDSITETFLIRVLEIFSHRKHGLLTCRLYHRPTSTPYHAVSYTWGEPLPPENAFRIYMIDEKSSIEGVILVRENLHDFLTVAAAQCEGVFFWVDALCINQNDVAERNKQVSRMGDIYSRAECVRIWGLDIASDLLKVLNGLSFMWDTVFADINVLVDGLAQAMSRLELLSAAHRLFGSTYFTRLWIIQEVFHGNNVQFYCGSECLDWSILELVHSAVSAFDFEILGDSFDKLQRVRRDFKTAGVFSSLDIAIEFSWDSVCSDIRDKVYGILSITRGGEDFEINYNEDCERLLVRALKHFSTPDISLFLEFSHKMVQLLELDYHKIYDYFCASDFEIDFKLSARLAVVWTPTTVRPSDTPAGIVCPTCCTAITFDENIPRLPLRLFLWCPKTGYDKRVRPTHVIFQHMYREQRPVLAHAPASHTMIDRISALLGWLSVPFGPVKNLLNRNFQAMIYQTSQTTTQPLPETDPTEEHPSDQEKWRYLRAIGWKMSDYRAFDTHFFRLNTISPWNPFAIIRSNDGPKFFRGLYDASVIFSAAQMIRFIFFVKRVPFDDEGWLSNYADEPPACTYQMLNPETRVHLSHRDSLVRTRTNIADYHSVSVLEENTDDRMRNNRDVKADEGLQHRDQSQCEDSTTSELVDDHKRRHSV